MNRLNPTILLFPVLIAVGFAMSGGIETTIKARHDQERNERLKDGFAIANKAIDALDRHYLASAAPLNDVVDLAPSLRQRNWMGATGGSCVHASTISLLRWQGLDDVADEWRKRYSGGEGPGPHCQKLASMGLKYVVTTDGDWSLIEWACATRRGCGVGLKAAHCIDVVGLEGDTVITMDNNHPQKFDRLTRAEFKREWDGWAFAIVSGTVPPPVPR